MEKGAPGPGTACGASSACAARVTEGLSVPTEPHFPELWLHQADAGSARRSPLLCQPSQRPLLRPAVRGSGSNGRNSLGSERVTSLPPPCWSLPGGFLAEQTRRVHTGFLCQFRKSCRWQVPLLHG